MRHMDTLSRLANEVLVIEDNSLELNLNQGREINYAN